MPSDEASRLIYEHYTKQLGWLMDWESQALGASFRHVHELSVLLSQVDLTADLLPLATFERETGLTALLDAGNDPRFEAFCALDSSVGNLLRIVRNLDCYHDEEARRPILENTAYWPTIPSADDLFSTRTVTQAWMEALRQLRSALAVWDVAVRQIPTDVTSIIVICKHAYILASRFYEIFSIIEFAIWSLTDGEGKRDVPNTT